MLILIVLVLVLVFLPLIQMHPLGLCNSNDEEDLYEYGWVGVVKLEQPQLDPSCLTVLGKVSLNHKQPGWLHCFRLLPPLLLPPFLAFSLFAYCRWEHEVGLINEDMVGSWIVCILYSHTHFGVNGRMRI